MSMRGVARRRTRCVRADWGLHGSYHHSGNSRSCSRMRSPANHAVVNAVATCRAPIARPVAQRATQPRRPRRPGTPPPELASSAAPKSLRRSSHLLKPVLPTKGPAACDPSRPNTEPDSCRRLRWTVRWCTGSIGPSRQEGRQSRKNATHQQEQDRAPIDSVLAKSNGSNPIPNPSHTGQRDADQEQYKTEHVFRVSTAPWCRRGLRCN